MKTLKPMAVALLCVAAKTVVAQEPAWNASAIKECDRACLVGVLDGYLDALFRKDQPTSFKITVADPVTGEVAFQGRLKVQGRDTLAAIRLKVDRGRITEIEQLRAGGIAPQAIELLTTARVLLTETLRLAVV